MIRAYKYKLVGLAVIIGIIVCAGLVGYFLPHCLEPTNRAGISNQTYRVVKVIDGDTIKAEIGKKIETIRLLGINTPEVENPYRHQECFGPEASKETKKLLTGKRVYLLPDPASPNRGKYNRLLRYVFLPNGEFVNAELIKNGYAFAYIYDHQSIQFESYFNFLEEEAKKKRFGLWSEKCNYYNQR